MIELKHQVSNLELSIKLRDLGVNQTSMYMWAEDIMINPALKLKKDIRIYHESHGQFAHLKRIASAYTVAELGEMLPDCYDHNGDITLNISKEYNTGKYIWYIDYGEDCSIIKETKDITEANARAKMLIWLIENNKVKI